MTQRLEELKEDVTEIQKHFGLSDYEALQIALKMEANETLNYALIDPQGDAYLSELVCIREQIEEHLEEVRENAPMLIKAIKNCTPEY